LSTCSRQSSTVIRAMLALLMAWAWSQKPRPGPAACLPRPVSDVSV